VAMAQLRADIHQVENEKKRKRDSKKLNQNITPPIIEGDREIIDVDSQVEIQGMLEDLQDEAGYITTEQDWKERLDEWNELLIEEENAQILANTEEALDFGELDDDLLSSYTHPAVDMDAKWDLRDCFIREFERPEFISVSSEFN
jgi:hypothetical protein